MRYNPVNLAAGGGLYRGRVFVSIAYKPIINPSGFFSLLHAVVIVPGMRREARA